MTRHLSILPLLLIGVLLAACAPAQSTAPPPPTAAPTSIPTAAPTATPTAESATAPTTEPASGGSNPYDIYLVAIADDGVSGEAIGCGDSLVAVPRGSTSSGSDAIQAALSDLFGLGDQYLGQSGLYNALYQSDLTVVSVSVDGSVATVAISGPLVVGGVCDEPRFTAQIEQTVLGVPGIETAAITVNGTPLDDLFSQQ